MKRTKAEREREHELESLRRRYEELENELRVLRIEKDLGDHDQSPPADDLFYSEDEEEVDEGGTKKDFQKFNLFGNNYCFGLEEPQRSSRYGCEEAKTPIEQQNPTNSESNWGLGASLLGLGVT